MTNKKLSKKTIRKALNAKGIKTVRFFPKLQCRLQAIKEHSVHWVFAEDYGFVILNNETAKLFNHARMKNGIKKLRVRDMDRMSIYRFPKRAFIYQKNNTK